MLVKIEGRTTREEPPVRDIIGFKKLHYIDSLRVLKHCMRFGNPSPKYSFTALSFFFVFLAALEKPCFVDT